MEENRRSFILNNSLAAVSALPLDDSTLATDGFNCHIHIFELDGSFREKAETQRAYRRLRSDLRTNQLTALGCCNENRLYFIDENYNECGFIELDTSCDFGCRCDCGCDDLSEVTDASLTTIGEERFIVGAFRRSAYLFDMNGRRLTKLCETDDDEILTDFVHAGNDLFALSTLNNRTRTITVSDNGCIQSAILSRTHTLRMLIAMDDGIYGLFGQNYIYNRIIKIYSDGTLRLPSRGFLCDT